MTEAELMFKVVGPIDLSEAEAAALMVASGGKPLACDFGPGLLRLKPKASPWALPLLAKMRGLASNDGLIVFGATEA